MSKKLWLWVNFKQNNKPKKITLTSMIDYQFSVLIFFSLNELLWSNIPQTDPWSSLETASSFLARPDFIQHVPPSKSVQAKWVQRGLEEQARPQSLASTLAASKCVTGKSQAFAQTESSAFCHWIFRSKENFWEKFYYYFGIFLILNLYFRFWSI
jgi:hypothetical protein